MPPEQDTQTFSKEDLDLVSSGDDENDGEVQTEEEGADAKSNGKGAEDAVKAKESESEEEAEKSDPKPDSKKTLATGKTEESESEEDPDKPYWPDNWRDKMARHYAGNDEKAFKRELNRLKRFADPSGVYGFGREAEGKLTSGGLLKVPDKDASEEDIANFHKALGVPEKPGEYFDQIKLENGAVIGDADKPIADSFAEEVHKTGATPKTVSAAMNWFFRQQEAEAVAQDEADDEFLRASQSSLKEDWGAAYKRKTNAIASLFVTAPGGTDVANEESLFARIMGGRTSDGQIIGNDPEAVRWFASVAHDVNPQAAVVEDGDMSGKSAEKELAEIKELRKTDKRKYFTDAVQKRETELIDAIAKHQARS